MKFQKLHFALLLYSLCVSYYIMIEYYYILEAFFKMPLQISPFTGLGLGKHGGHSYW